MNDKFNKIERIENLGIGCFVFSINLTKEKATSEVIVDITEKLRNLPGISNLLIKQNFSSPSRLPAAEIDLIFLDICFDVDLSSDPEYSFEGENKYKIIIKSFYDTPVAVIMSKFPTEDPSTGVFKVRRFLQKYLKEPFNLKIIGPSPFHANFFITRANSKFELNIVKSRGYDVINILSTKNKTLDIIEEFFEELGDELNFFYMLKDLEITRAKMWEEVTTSIDKINAEDENWLKKKWESFFVGKYLHQAMKSIITFESNSINFQQLSVTRHENTYNTGKNYLISYIEKEKPYIYAVDAMKKLLDFHILIYTQKRESFRTGVNTVFNVFLTAAVTYLFFTVGIR